MDRVIAVLGLGIVAFAVWLTVRIVNRREKWAIRVAAAAGVMLAYPLSLGPICWLVQHQIVAPDSFATAYEPLFELEFQAPESLQDAAVQLAKMFQVETAYIGMRDTLFLRSYPIGDISFRWKDGRRAFDEYVPWLPDIITATIEPGSWEHLSGPGRIGLAANETLDIWQTRRIHAEVESFIEKIRSFKAAAIARGRDLDARTLGHALWGFYDEPHFRPSTVRIENPTGDQLVVGESTFTGFDELLEFLGKQPREMLRAGIYWSEIGRHPSRGDVARLKELCEARDLDLFIRPKYRNVIGQPVPRQWWIVRASDTIYLDPE